MNHILFAILFATTINTCNTHNDCKNAVVSWHGDPASDGMGWVLELGTDKFEVPENLPDSFKVTDTKVKVCFKATDKRVECRCATPRFLVNISSITRR
jgi:hypothetical protein